MRVLHVVFSLDAGGMENGLINVANALKGEYEFHVACLEFSGRMAKRFPCQDKIYILDKTPGFSPRTIVRLRRLIRQVRPDLLHTHNLGPLIYGALATHFGAKVPILHGEHSQFSREDLRMKRLQERRLFYRSVRRVHTVSRGLTDELLELGMGKGKLVTVVNGVDTVRFCPGASSAVRQEIGIPGNAMVAGIVGRFGPYKGHRILIEAFERIRERGVSLHLLVVGSGGLEEEEVREQCRTSRHADFIHLFGFSEHPEKLYPAIDLLVAPSWNEGLSNVVLEAMACGIPALTNACCGSAEVIESDVDGVVADLSTANHLAREWERLLADPNALRRMGAAARRKILERFSLDRMARDYASLYEELKANVE